MTSMNIFNSFYFSLFKKDLLVFFRGPFLTFGLFSSALNCLLSFSLLENGVFENAVLDWSIIIFSVLISSIFFSLLTAGFLFHNDFIHSTCILKNSWDLSRQKLFFSRLGSLFVNSCSLFVWMAPFLITICILSTLSYEIFFLFFIFLALFFFFISGVHSLFFYFIEGRWVTLFLSTCVIAVVTFGSDPNFLALFFGESIPTFVSVSDIFYKYLKNDIGFFYTTGYFLVLFSIVCLVSSFLFFRKKRFK